MEQTFERHETPKPLVDEWRLTGATVLWWVLLILYDVIREQCSCFHAIFSNSSAELILGLD